ncbi:hypothetical protein [uncultured Psychroserpens sp.]|uniref:hypothetical protein n=1 Tax=uncultured Psychroserpens sp. TaxID=255436 RepID=UPI002616FEE1|nr:hypothetical protein [uncultured Psychroserpens sp.]
MRKLNFKVLAILAIMLSMSCSVDNLEQDYQNEALERKIDADINSEKDHSERSRNNSSQDATNSSNLTIVNEMPAGTETQILYFNMSELEYELIQSPFQADPTVPFNIYFRNLMSLHYTIYTIEESTICENVERWVVNKQEYDLYKALLDSTGASVFNPNPDNTGGGQTSNTGPGLGGVDGTKAGPPVNGGGSDDDDDDEEDDPDLDPKEHLAQCFPNNVKL